MNEAQKASKPIMSRPSIDLEDWFSVHTIKKKDRDKCLSCLLKSLFEIPRL